MRGIRARRRRNGESGDKAARQRTGERTRESERVEKLDFHEDSAGNLKGLVKMISLSLSALSGAGGKRDG